MQRWPFRQIFVLVLGVLATLGMSPSVAQFGVMPVKMAMASDMGASMGASAQVDCQDCGSAGDVDVKAMSCNGVCVPPVLVPLTQQLPAVTISLSAHAPPPKALLAAGWASPPDPYPPRPHIFG